MKLLTFQANFFQWATFSKTLDEVAELDVNERMEDCVVAFIHAEEKDEGEAGRTLKHMLKHIKWVAGKGGMKRVVLHSFTHLGGRTASPSFAQELMGQLAERLSNADYEVKQTPFGYFCSWNIDVRGESMAKVFKDI